LYCSIYRWSCYVTIQGAVTAATNGDEIIIQPGSYTLNSPLVIDKNLTITGGGVNTTTILTEIDIYEDQGGLILVKDNAQVTISNLAFDLSGVNIYQAIKADNADYLNLYNVSFKYISGSAISYTNTNGTINNVSFENILRIGLKLYGESNLNVTNFSYIGIGSMDWQSILLKL
jgi:hypothetical protein